MANVAKSSSLRFDDRSQQFEFKDWIESDLAPQVVTHFITIRLMRPDNVIDPEKWNTRSLSSRDGLIRQIIQRADKSLYGKSHENLASDSKFEFLMLEETRSRSREPSFAHIHGVWNLRGKELDKFKKKQTRIEEAIWKLVRQRGLYPDIDIREADRGVVDYISKSARFDAASINTRATV